MNDIEPHMPAPELASSSQRALPLWVVVLAAATVAGIGMGLRQAMGL